MAQQVVFKDCWTRLKGEITGYWDKKTIRIERLLQNYRPELRRLRLTMHHRPNAYEAHCVLLLPTGTLVATSASRSYMEAMDNVTDHIVQEIRRHRDLIRRDGLHSQRRGNRRSAVA